MRFCMRTTLTASVINCKTMAHWVFPGARTVSLDGPTPILRVTRSDHLSRQKVTAEGVT